MASFIYNEAKKQILEGTILWTSQIFKAVLVTSAYSPNPDHTFVSSASVAELSGSGYVGGFNGAGRKVITGKTIVKDDSVDRAYFDCADISWIGLDAGTAGALLIIQEVTSDSDSKLVAFLQLDPELASDGTNVVLRVPTNGWAFI